MLLEVLELMHAVLLHVEDLSPDGDISELNNAVRSRLDEMRELSSFLQGDRK